MPNAPAPFTAFPNALLDQTMPSLKDTEWRVLCVVVRQTLGWQVAGTGEPGRKQRDWLAQRQLIARTGRNSAAISSAVDALVKKGLVETRTASGVVLDTPAQRRRHRGRVYFGLGLQARLLLETHQSTTRQETGRANSPLGKSNTTKETGDKTKSINERFSASGKPLEPLRVHRGWSRAGQVARDAYLEGKLLESRHA